LAAHCAVAAGASVPDHPIPAAQAAGKMTLPDHFQATLFAGEPDVVQPIAFTFDDRGRLWVAEAMTYPNWDFNATGQTKGHDRITIFEDTTDSGHFDKRTVFADDLINVSGLEVGFGGVYVCSPPDLIFIPIKPGEDKPAGPPQVLLDGWNIREAQHNIFNGLTWGPDGWLYGLNGIQSKSAVGAPGTPDAKRVKFDCGVWRYHPTRHTFEVVCWGTTNPWGLDFDDFGQGFITNCVIKHAWQVIPGAHFQRMHGQDYNPNVYSLMESCADHFHWAGGRWQDSHDGDVKNLEAGGGHAHVGAMIYLGDNFPDSYRNSLFTCNLHGNRVNNDPLEQHGSGYIAHHGPDFLLANDPWFRGISIKYGPDGGVFVSDWSDTGECHNHVVVDRTNGRIYKVTYGTATPLHPDLVTLTDDDLVTLQTQHNDWLVRHARRVLQERAATRKITASATNALQKLLTTDPDVRHELRALWAIHAIGGVSPSQIMSLLDHREPYMRGWAIQLALEDRNATPELLAKFAAMAKADPSPVVRLFLASALQRLPAEQRFEIASNLCAHEADAADQNLPLMLWYGVEPLAATDTGKSIELAAGAKIPIVREYVARRVAQGSPAGLEAVVALLEKTTDSHQQVDLLHGIQASFNGQRHVAMPAGWKTAYAQLRTKTSSEVSDAASLVALVFGDADALTAERAIVTDAHASAERRSAAVTALAGAQDPQLATLLQGLLKDAALRGTAIRGLSTVDDDATPALLIGQYSTLSESERRDAVQTLSARPKYALALLDAIESGKIPRSDISAFTIRQLSNFKEPAVKNRLTKVWGTIRTPAGDKSQVIAHLKSQLAREDMTKANLPNGRAVFNRTCAACHTLFDAGGKVGPNLTGSQRANLDYVLENVVDPSAVVAREYQMVIVDAKDGRTINGIVVAENDKSLTIRTINEDITLPLSEITHRRLSPISMMPEGLLENLKSGEVRDLIAYLASSQQVAAP
jgi:putative membrane-bound dehydrogenase-like protein